MSQLPLREVACCPVCRKDGPPDWIRERRGCCCIHTPPRSFEPEKDE